MYTEEEAKKKWCPYRGQSYQLAHIGSSLYTHLLERESDKIQILEEILKENETSNDDCIASDCMMIQWATMYSDGSGYSEHKTKTLAEKAKHENDSLIIYCYCGLTK